MMRAILFRGTRLDNGKWVEGFYFERKDAQGKIIESVIIEDAYEQVTGGMRYIRSNLNRECYRVDSDTIGQFTGMTDKDGKRIFEGDIITFHKFRYEPDWTGVVKYEHCLYLAVGTMPLASEKRIGEDAFYASFEVQLSSIDDTTIEVIGNIHDNPQLPKEDA